MAKRTLDFHYRFLLKNEAEKEFFVRLDADSLILLTNPAGSPPDWTNLSYHQCPNCPLKEADQPRCPVALNLSDLIQFFVPFLSYEEVEVSIATEQRTYVKKTTVQKGLSSLMGIYMVTSGCPILDQLRPMVRHHLPFATMDETQYRALSMYLVGQYFGVRKGKKGDWELKGLKDLYREIGRINVAFKKRLAYLKGEDAIPNAMVILNFFADSFLFSLREDDLKRLESLFLG